MSEDEKLKLRDKYALREDAQAQELWPVFLEHLEEMFVDGLMPLNQSYRECNFQYRSIIALMHKFYADMRHNPKKNTLFPHTELQRLLKLSGFVANSGDGRE